MKLISVLLLLVCLLVWPLAAQPAVRWEPFALPTPAPGVRAELGMMTVPLMRSNPGGGTAEIAFLRLQTDKGKGKTPIVYLNGGPGGSSIGLTHIPEMTAAFAAIAELGDVILLDPRGVGRSTPRPVCAPPRTLEPHEKFAEPAVLLPSLLESVKNCVAQWSAKGVDVRAFTNRETAADIDDLRLALGAPKISIIGFSYGTHLALAVLNGHPQSVERLVLAGTEGPNHTRKLPLTLDMQLAKLSLLAGTDMNATLRRVLANLKKAPIAVSVLDRARKEQVSVSIGASALRRILTYDIGDGNDFIVFPALLTTLEQGDSSILRWFAEKRYNQITGGVNLMVTGLECSSGATELRQREIDRQAKTSVLADAANFPYPQICAALPSIDLGDDFRSTVSSLVPALFISGTLDSNTPPFQAEEVRWGMPNAVHLIVENAGHEDTLAVPAVQKAIFDFLAGRDVRGRSAELPRPRFRTIEEARRERQ